MTFRFLSDQEQSATPIPRKNGRISNRILLCEETGEKTLVCDFDGPTDPRNQEAYFDKFLSEMTDESYRKIRITVGA